MGGKTTCQNQTLVETRLIMIYGEECSHHRVGRVLRFGKFNLPEKI